MSLPVITEIENLDEAALNLKVIETRREIFNLRLKKATFQSFKPHLFKHAKHRLAQLLTVQTNRQLNKNITRKSNTAEN